MQILNPKEQTSYCIKIFKN